MEDKIEELKFVKLPVDSETGKEQKEFEEMLGHIYIAYYSETGKGYVIIGSNSEEANKAFDNTIYKTLISAGEDEEFARACAYEEEDPGMCMYIPKECFEIILERVRTLIDIEYENEQIKIYEKLEIYKKFIKIEGLSKKFEKFYAEEIKRKE